MRFTGGLVIVTLIAGFLAPLTPSTVAQSLIGAVDVGDNLEVWPRSWLFDAICGKLLRSEQEV